MNSIKLEEEYHFPASTEAASVTGAHEAMPPGLLWGGPLTSPLNSCHSPPAQMTELITRIPGEEPVHSDSNPQLLTQGFHSR